MALTGDLENLSIVDIIQLVHTTRKSGIFSVKGSKGESKLVFSHGYIVGANHINDRVRIGTVLVKTGAITVDDLKQAVKVTNDASEKQVPLMATLMQMGKLKREDAQRGLRKLIEMTIVELMSWTKGTFTFDTDAVIYSPEGAAASGDMEQAVGVDAQMVLMDALRIYDERERDRADGKAVQPFEALFADVLQAGSGGGAKGGRSAITADDLGLADLDRLERKIPQPGPGMEVFDPVAIHRQNIQEMLADFSSEEQEAFVTFLRRSVNRTAAPKAAAQQAGKAVVVFSGDTLMTHAVMTICKDEGVPVFAAEGEAALERTVSQCLSAGRTPVVVFDVPEGSGVLFPGETIAGLRSRVRKKFSGVPLMQLAPLQDCDFILRSYDDGVRAVLPKPVKETRRETYVQDMIRFLGTFTSYIKGFQERPDTISRYAAKLRSGIRSLRETADPSDALLAALAAVAEMLERSVMFFVRSSELCGERAIGVGAEKSRGPAPAHGLKIPLSKPSLFRDVIEKRQTYYGEGRDPALKDLFREIGEPLSPAVVLLPLICDQKVVAVVYGDFGKKQASPVPLDILKILAQQVGMILECTFFRGQTAKAPQKSWIL